MAVTIIQDSGKLCEDFVEHHLRSTLDAICKEEVAKAKDNIEKRIKEEMAKVSVTLDRNRSMPLDKPNITIVLKS